MDMVSVMFDHDVDQEQNQSVEIWGGCPKKFGELADVGNKIPYELLCGISERVTRVYKSNSGEAN
jgi:alanine racemase